MDRDDRGTGLVVEWGRGGLEFWRDKGIRPSFYRQNCTTSLRNATAWDTNTSPCRRGRVRAPNHRDIGESWLRKMGRLPMNLQRPPARSARLTRLISCHPRCEVFR